MAKEFKRSTQDDFGGMIDMAAAKEVDGSVKIISRYAKDLTEDDNAIKNFDRINMDLSKFYASKNGTHNDQGGEADTLYWSPDDTRRNSNASRGTFDRYIWAGEFKKDGTNTVFKSSEIGQNGGTQFETDGMMMIPSPYVKFEEGKAILNAKLMPDSDGLIQFHNGSGGVSVQEFSMQAATEVPQESFRIKIKSNGGLPQKTFIPLFGYVKGHAVGPRAFENSNGTAYRSKNSAIVGGNGTTSAMYLANEYNAGNTIVRDIQNYADEPCALAGEINPTNLYNKAPENGVLVNDSSTNYTDWYNHENDILWHLKYSNEYTRNSIVWFVYAWENINGQDFGMILTMPGEAPCSTHRQTRDLENNDVVNFYGPDGCYRHRPTNQYFGDRDGYLKWEAPAELRKMIDDGMNLQQIYDHYNTTVRNSRDSYDPRRSSSMPIIHTHYRDHQSVTLGGYNNGEYLSSVEGEELQLKNSLGDLGYSNGYNYNYMNGGGWRAYTFRGGANQLGVYSNSDGTYPNRRMGGGQNWVNSTIVSFGEVTSNANLSTAAEIKIDAKMISAEVDRYTTFQNAIYRGAGGFLYDIEEIDANADGINDNIRNKTFELEYTSNGVLNQIMYAGSFLDFNFRDVPGQLWNDYARYYGTSATQQNAEIQCGGPNAIVLRPTIEGNMEVHDFSYATYVNTEDSEVLGEKIGGGTTMQHTYRTPPSTTFDFVGGGYSYNPTRDVTSNQLSNSGEWSDALNLLDGDLTTRATVNAAGPENALFIALSDSETTINTPSNFDVTHFGITVRGVTLSALNNHSLRFAVVGNNNPLSQDAPIFTTVANDGSIANQDRLDIADVPIGNTLISPDADGAYHIKFSSDNASPVSYADLQTAFLKIWAEKI